MCFPFPFLFLTPPPPPPLPLPLCGVVTHSNNQRTNSYMLLEYVPGGSLYHRIHVPSMSGASSAGAPGTNPLPEESARFYAASVCLALGFMHSRGVVWRNCCPENILLDAEGYVRLVDFETAKAVPSGEHTHTLCGCASYLAPEMLLCKGHRAGVDWWAFGVLIFETLTGHTPFEDLPLKRNDIVMRNIVRGAYTLPNDLPEFSPDLLDRLLTPHPSKRLGCQVDRWLHSVLLLVHNCQPCWMAIFFLFPLPRIKT